MNVTESQKAALDVAANRASQKYRTRELWARAAWTAAMPLFRWSPRLLWGWRNSLLRVFGAQIGRHVHIHPTVRIQHPWLLDVGDFAAIGDRVRLYNLATVTIGARATISQSAHLCAGTHDYSSPDMRLIKLPISVGADAWVCADAFIGPGVAVGAGAVVGARAAAFKDVDPWTIVGGNPARYIKDRAVNDTLKTPSQAYPSQTLD